MPRIRSVSPDICTDPDLVGLSGDAERLFVRLWTHLDDDGRCEDDLLLLKAALFPRHRHIGEDDIERWLRELAINGQIIRYTAKGMRLLTAKPEAWARYQKPRRHIDSKLPGIDCADIVGTAPDTCAQSPAGGGDVGGGEMEMDKETEGESEGEPEQTVPSLRSVDNPRNPAALSLVERCASIPDRIKPTGGAA